MRCKHKPILNIPVREGKKTVCVFHLFPASCWGGGEGLFRVMRGEAWVRRGGKPGLFDLGAVLRLVHEAAAGHLGLEFEPFEPTLPPALPRGSRVRLPMAGPVVVGEDPHAVELEDSPSAGATLTRTRTEPVHDGGQWFVYVVGQAGPVPVTGLDVVPG